MRVGVGPMRLHVSRVAHNGHAPLPATQEPPSNILRELGAQGRSAYSRMGSSEYNPEWRGRKKFKIINEMKRSDNVVNAALLLMKLPVLSGEWYVKPFSYEPEDLEAAELIEWNLANMHSPFITALWELLHFPEYGFYILEQNYEETTWTPLRKGAHTRRIIKWEDWSPRHPETIDEWQYDERNGRLVGAYHTQPVAKGQRVPLPREKILLFTWGGEAGDPEGIPILRSAYRPYYFRERHYKIDAIQKERHGLGIPRGKLMPGYNPDDKTELREMLQNLRTNEKAFVIQNPMFEIDFVELKGQVVNALESADDHGRHILTNILASFVENTTAEGDKRTGAQANIYIKALRFLADLVASEINQHAIPRLLDWNFTLRGYPKIGVRRMFENAELRTLAVAIRNLIDPGLITPTPEDEEWFREMIDWPTSPKEARERPAEDRLKRQRDGGREDPGNVSRGRSPRGNPTE